VTAAEARRPAPATEPAPLARALHDLRGPLTIIRGMCALLRREDGGGDPRRAAALIEREVLRLAAGLDALAQRGAGPSGPRPGPVSLRALAARVAESHEGLARLRSVRLSVRASRAPVTVVADREALRRALDNLVQNALRHTPPGGEVRIVVAARGGRAVLRVHDDGPGVPVGDRARIFAPGERGSAPVGEGSGLGLAIAREIAERHGGRLTLDALGSGACFRLALPLARPAGRVPSAA
jgi:two-component system sensor histidine kinase BaeS